MYEEKIRKFYEKFWAARDRDAIASILHENLIFRGSPRYEKQGQADFSEFADMVYGALGKTTPTSSKN